MEYTIRKYTPSFEDALVKLLHHSFVIANRDKRALVQWKYFHPFFRSQTITWIAIDPTTNTLVGHYTNVPVPLSQAQRVTRAMLCTDMTTHAQHRGKGLISTLAKLVYAEVVESGAECSFGFSNAQGVKVDRHAAGYGYVIVGQFVRYVRLVGIPRHTPIQLKRIERFSHADFEPVFEQFHVRKNAEYRKWRYEDKPYNDYRLYEVLHDGTFLGFVVLRILGKTCHIYDVMVDQQQSSKLPVILMAIRAEAKTLQCRWVVCSMLEQSRLAPLFLRSRFIRTSLRSQSYYLTVKLHSKELRHSGILDPRNWILFGGDIL